VIDESTVGTTTNAPSIWTRPDGILARIKRKRNSAPGHQEFTNQVKYSEK
jgi:hypothetical protein